METLRNLDVQISMEKTVETLKNALENAKKSGSKNTELAALISQKITEAETYYDRPLDSPGFYAQLKDYAASVGDTKTVKDCEAKIKRMEAYDLEFKGRLLAFYGNNTEALKYLAKAAELDPTFKEAVSEKEKAENAIAKASKELPVLNSKLASASNDTKLLYKKAVASLHLGKADEAMTCLDKILTIEPNNLEALTKKGTTLESMGKYKESLQYFDKVLAVKPTALSAKRGKTYAEYNLGKFSV